MRNLMLLAIATTLLMLSGCSAPSPLWRQKAQEHISKLDTQEAAKLFPDERRSIMEVFSKAEALFQADEVEAADPLYQMTIQKAALLETSVKILKNRQHLEAKRKAEAEALRKKEEKLLQEAAKAESRLDDAEEPDEEVEPPLISTVPKKKTAVKEVVKPKPATYTVRRGETLPQIAARNEIYNDSSMWPLIYRANRDQIRDPKRLWPGQVLKIPRSSGRVQSSNGRR